MVQFLGRRSLRDELLNGEIFYTLQEARVLIEMWRRQYNRVRPHSSLGYRPPAPEAVPGPPIAIARPRLDGCVYLYNPFMADQVNPSLATTSPPTLISEMYQPGDWPLASLP